MPKHFCTNSNCEEFEKLVDIDSSYICYYRNFEHTEFKIIERKLCCVKCNLPLTLEDRYANEKTTPFIGKYGTSSYEEKINMLKKRSKDLSINENKIIKERKEYMDRNGITKYVN